MSSRSFNNRRKPVFDLHRLLLLLKRSSSCPFCHLTLPSSDLERHANSHFEDEDIQLKQQQQQLAADFELAQQIALSPSPKLHSISLLSEQSIRDMQFESTSGSKKSWCHDRNMDDREWTMEEKISCLIDLQTRSTFYKVEGGLMALLRKCLESEPGKTTSILSGYIDHFQSIVSEDVGWGCGWRNIQMLSSHLLVQRQEVREVLFGGSGFVPDIPSLQRWLEIAWERGFDVLGSDQFSHSIYGSKKWIGATECASLLRSFGLRARIVDFGPKKYESLYLSVPGSSIGAQGMRTNTKKKSKEVHLYGPIDRYFSRDVHQAGSSCQETSNSFKVQVDSTIGIRSREDIANNITKNSEGHQFLMDFVWNYFSDQSSTTFGNQHVIVSEKTPLYFQHDGHSRMIIGIQVKHGRTGNQQYNLLVLDPGHRTTALARSLRENVGWQKLLKRGIHTLKKPQYQLCYVDHGIASAEEMDLLKTIDSVFLEF